MAKMIAVRRCYVNDRIYEPGDIFEFEGVQGSAFHPLGGTPLPPINIETLLTKAAQAKPVPIEAPAVKAVAAGGKVGAFFNRHEK